MEGWWDGGRWWDGDGQKEMVRMKEEHTGRRQGTEGKVICH